MNTIKLPLNTCDGYMKALLKCLIFVALLFAAPAFSASRVSSYTKTKLQRELPQLGMSIGDHVLLRTFKQESILELWIKPSGATRYALFRSYPICIFSGGLGPKIKQGDKQTPEGFYGITRKGLQPYSRYHLSLNIGYPNAYDRYHKRTGDLLMVHGSCDSLGCFAMGNAQIEEIYYLVEQALKAGQKRVPVHAFPFYMSDENIEKQQSSRWYSFWQQLQVGYTLFNKTKKDVRVSTDKGQYIFSEHSD